ncbi:hypothetical protein H1235_12745 [Pseudoxanthomonas sp. NC8]|nr:hypothetical protein H1235_12745 [Pseudoxanthomonas sp. NC8]
MSPAYLPVNCEFHDVLEATAMRGRPTAIHHRRADGQAAVSHARIVDLHAQDGIEYMDLDDGTRLRLDHVESVDGIQAGAFGPACAVADGAGSGNH